MMTCSKIFLDIPFAHRQHRHSGHCARIHGHNWTLKLTFACNRFDKNGFVGESERAEDELERPALPGQERLLGEAEQAVWFVRSPPGDWWAAHIFSASDA